MQQAIQSRLQIEIVTIQQAIKKVKTVAIRLGLVIIIINYNYSLVFLITIEALETIRCALSFGNNLRRRKPANKRALR